MRRAPMEARAAFDEDEIPVGAIIVCRDRIISRAHNLTEMLTDVTAHAEMQAITSGANMLGGKYERLYPLRYGRTLRDVRRSAGMGTDQPRGIWCQRREKGVYKICARCTAS